MGMQFKAAIYCRLSKDDDQKGESVSIGTQKSMLSDYCNEHGVEIYDYYVDDGYSGTNFNRPAFKRLLEDIDSELINMVVTKDLSRLGRDYIMTGYYSEIYFPSRQVRYVALSDNFDTENIENDIAPFKNILNDMYARDISRKIKAAKRQHAKNGMFVASQPPYGYKPDSSNRHRLVVDDEAAEVVRLIYNLALQGLDTVKIAHELDARKILTPKLYKSDHNDGKSTQHQAAESLSSNWSSATVRAILKNKVYLGDIYNIKTESVSYKTKQRRNIPADEWVVGKNTHEPIINRDDYDKVQEIIAQHQCPAKFHRENIFRNLLFCSDCGHPLSIAHRKLTYYEDDCYRCTQHFYHPSECSQTHIIYHKPLSDFVLNELHALAKAMKRRNVQSAIVDCENIEKLTPEILRSVINRIEIGHVTKKSKMKKIVKIYWKL